MVISPTVHALALLYTLPGLGLFRHAHPAPPDTIPPRWNNASIVALSDSLVFPTLPPVGDSQGPRLTLQPNNDPRRLRVAFDPDSGAVTTQPMVGDVGLAPGNRAGLVAYAHEMTLLNYQRLWRTMSVSSVNSLGANTPSGAGHTGGLSFALPSPLPQRVQSLLGPGGPALNVSGSENISFSGTSTWTNQQIGLIGQNRSLFPTLDMQQNLDIKLEGQLSDRIKVNLLQNSLNQIPLSNRIAITYKGDEDDLIQEFDLGNTSLTLPGTQYVSYSGMNEGLFGLKTTAKTGPLDMTLLASRQEGRSERASFQGGTGKRDNSIMDVDFVRGVYFFLFDPNNGPRLIDEGTLHVYITPPTLSTDANLVRGRAKVDPSNPETTAVLGNFRELTAGADHDFEIMRLYGPNFKVLRLKQPVDPRQCLAVTYNYLPVGTDGNPLPGVAAVPVGGRDTTLADGTVERSMELVRPPEDQLAKEAGSGLGSPVFYADTGAFNVTRELELKSVYQLGGSRIDPKTFSLSIRRGTDQPFTTSILTPGGPIPYIEAVGLDNYDETSGTPVFGQHDGRVDGTAAGGNNQLHVAVDFDNGLLFLPDPHPFAPRIGTGGKPFDNAVSGVLSRRVALTGPPDSTNGANPNIYRKYVNQGALDAEYYMDVSYTAASVGNEIQLGRGNILAGSEVVSVNGVPWKANVDYTIDYDLGRVVLKRQVGPNDNLNIDYAYAPLFQQASQTLIGSAFHLEGRDKRMGGAFMYESRAAQDLRPRLGEEPATSLIGDLNGEWLAHPIWMTRAADRLPGVRTTAPSDFHIQGEVGASLPNPNTKNVVYIDDMEGVRDAVSLSMGPERWRWSSVPSRMVSGFAQSVNSLDHQHNAEVHWYSPPNVVKEHDLKPTLTQAQGGENTHQVLSISLPRRPTSARNDFVTGNFDTLWAGMTYLLDPVGLDLSRSQFIELWVNDFNDMHDIRHPAPRVRGRHVKLHIDVGRVSEDMQRAPDRPPNGKLDSEDRNRDGQLQVTGDTFEDTGYDDSVSVADHSGDIAESGPSPDLVTVGPDDPNGDDFHGADATFPNEVDTRRYRFTNGPENNKNFNPTPDTEDLNQNNVLDQNESYFEYTIDLGDTSSTYPYLAAGGDLQKEKAAGTPGYGGVADDNGWRRYRIPLADSLRQAFGIPDLTLAQHVRVWLEGVIDTDPADSSLGMPPPPAAPDYKNYPVRPLLMLGSLDIVASRWQVQPLDSNTTANGTTVTLNAVNTVDNSNIYTPPFDPGQSLNGSQSVTRREQSLSLEFTHLLPNDTISVFRNFSIDEDYTRYDKMTWYTAAFQIPGYIPVADSLYYFVRFASDETERSYYEYRAPVPPSSADRAIAWQTVLLRLTALSNLKLNSDFPRNDPILYQSPGLSANEIYTIRGRPSFTRIRRISMGIINGSTNPSHVYETGQLWLDEIRAIDVARDRGQAERLQLDGHVANVFGYNLTYDGRNADFLTVGQTRGTGINSGNLTMGANTDIQRFIEGTGIALPLSYSYSRSSQKPRYSAGDDVVRTNQQADASETRNETRTWNAAYSRSWSARTSPLLLYTLGGITASMSRTVNTSRNPSYVDTTKNTIAAVNYGVSLRDLFSLPMPGTKSRLFLLPEKVFWNYALNKRDSHTYDRLNDSTRTLVLRNISSGRVATIQFGGDFRPVQMLHEHFDGTRNLMLGDLNEHWGFVNLGRVVNWRQGMDAGYSMNRGPWLRPTFSWNGGYSQNNGPELQNTGTAPLTDLSIRAVGNSQTLTMNWGLPFESLAPARGAPRDTTRKRPRFIASLLSRLGEFGVDGNYASASTYSRLTGTPSLLYITGLSRDPGFGNDTTGRVQSVFGNASTERTDVGSSAHTRVALALGSSVNLRGHYGSHWSNANSIVRLSVESQFPDIDVDYGRIPAALRLDRLLKEPHLRTGFNRSTQTDFQGINDDHIGTAISNTWSPLLGIDGQTRNGTRAEFKVETRSSWREDLLNGRSVSQDRNTNVSLNLTRTYTQGQKMVILGKSTTVRSTVTLGLTGSYTRRTGDTRREGDTRRYFPIGQDRLDVNGNGSYAFSNNVTGNVTLGYGQTRNLLLDSVYRTIRVELRGQFTF